MNGGLENQNVDFTYAGKGKAGSGEEKKNLEECEQGLRIT